MIIMMIIIIIIIIIIIKSFIDNKAKLKNLIYNQIPLKNNSSQNTIYIIPLD